MAYEGNGVSRTFAIQFFFPCLFTQLLLESAPRKKTGQATGRSPMGGGHDCTSGLIFQFVIKPKARVNGGHLPLPAFL
jgi:hypothetical protein